MAHDKVTHYVMDDEKHARMARDRYLTDDYDFYSRLLHGEACFALSRR